MSDVSTLTPYEAAVAAVKRGWKVIPVHGLDDETPSRCTCYHATKQPTCKDPGKHPAEPKWQFTDDISVASCWTIWKEDHPKFNAGVLPGTPSGMVILDNDPRNGGNEHLQRAIAEYGPLPETYTVRTGSGGQHFYFDLPEGMTIPSRKLYAENGDKLSGVDVLSSSGQKMAILPGSTSQRGFYCVEKDLPLAQLPARWIQALTARASNASGHIVMAADLPHWAELSTRQQNRCRGYALKVINDECAAYENAGWGEGSGRLYSACCNMIEILQSPWVPPEVDKSSVLRRLEQARASRWQRAHAAGKHDNGQLPAEVEAKWKTAAARVRGKGRAMPKDDDDYTNMIKLPTSVPPITGGDARNPFLQPDQAEAAAIEALEGVKITEADRLQFAQAEAQVKFELDVRQKKYDLEVADAARKLWRSEQASTLPAPDSVLLSDLLLEPDEDIQYRIGGLWPSGGRVVLAAQFKAGKTTFVGNLTRSLVDGDPFLGRGGPFMSPEETSFAVRRLEGNDSMAILDLELGRNMIRSWYRDQQISGTDRVHMFALRGRAREFNILDEVTRDKWIRHLRERNVRIFVIDPLAPLLYAFGINEKNNEEVGPLLGALDELCEEAGIEEMLIVHHMGHASDRSRGASRLRDWPDVEWKLIKEGTVNDAGKDAASDAPRFFSAFGRDVLVQESRLTFDQESRRLFISGGDRKQQTVAKGIPVVLELIRNNPGIVTGVLEEELKIRGISRGPARVALSAAIASRDVHTYPGVKRAVHHFINDHCKTPAKCESGVRLNFAAPKFSDEDIEHGLKTIERVFTELFPNAVEGVNESKIRVHAMDENRELSVGRSLFDRAWDEALQREKIVRVGSGRLYCWDSLTQG